MELQLERGQKLYFQKKLKQTITHPFPVFSALLLYLCCSKNICNHPVCTSNDTRLTQFG
jgi:hypothetical protein